MLILIPVVKHGCSKKRKKEPDRTFDDISIAAKFYVGQKRRSGDFEILVLRKAQSGGEKKCFFANAPTNFFTVFRNLKMFLRNISWGLQRNCEKFGRDPRCSLYFLCFMPGRPFRNFKYSNSVDQGIHCRVLKHWNLPNVRSGTFRKTTTKIIHKVVKRRRRL